MAWFTLSQLKTCSSFTWYKELINEVQFAFNRTEKLPTFAFNIRIMDYNVIWCWQHRDTPENNPGVPFEFTPENKKVVLWLIFCDLMSHCGGTVISGEFAVYAALQFCNWITPILVFKLLQFQSFSTSKFHSLHLICSWWLVVGMCTEWNGKCLKNVHVLLIALVQYRPVYSQPVYMWICLTWSCAMAPNATHV